ASLPKGFSAKVVLNVETYGKSISCRCRKLQRAVSTLCSTPNFHTWEAFFRPMLCPPIFVQVFQEKLRLLEVESVFGGRAKDFRHPYSGLISDSKKATDK
ncbi:MAG: hypothetical protein NC115_12690, partial [Bacteroidales bacterium]|nr:hypothetical protein [Bacteroidales bacterium]